MIRLHDLNKYYNRRKSNEIHVINNTSLELPDQGIVALLGPSGSGKTTLLNVIGGLDKASSGEVWIDDERITGRSSGRIDVIRNAKIGYIFQNYNLLDDQTVFDNVAIALRMVGIRDKETIKNRVNYCLKAVGIYKFRKRRADALSGGQRQRVAIARALVKNPRIIIADEPTGNLDSSNTLEVMNIIKTISRDRLVLLVTHEQKLAEFYSSRIIEIKDGKVIADRENDSTKYLDYQLENKIYLKDMNISRHFAEDGVKVNVYSDEKRDADINIVLRGANLYIDTKGRYNVVDDTSDIEMIDDHYKRIDKSIYEDNGFKYDEYLPEGLTPKYKAIYNPWNSLIAGFKEVGNFKKSRKFLLVGFVFAAMFAFLAVSNILGLTNIEPSEFLEVNDHYITVSNPSKSEDLINRLASVKGVRYVIPGDSKIDLNMEMGDYYQTENAAARISGSLTMASTLKRSQLVRGRMPSGDRELVIDRMLVKKFLNAKSGKSAGITKEKDFIGRKVKVSGIGDYTIVGISDVDSPAVFVGDARYMDLLHAASGSSDEEDSSMADAASAAGVSASAEESTDDSSGSSASIKDQALAPASLKVKRGKAPSALYEVMVDERHAEDMPIGRTINKKVNGNNLKVTGYYSSDSLSDTYYVTADTIRADYMSRQKVASVYADDTSEVMQNLRDAGFSPESTYDKAHHDYMERHQTSLRTSLIAAGIILAISLIEVYLMLRSSFLARIKEVGTLRAIGIKKREITRMFAGEITAITIVTAIPGIALMYYIWSNVIKITVFLRQSYMINPQVAVLTFVLLLIFNLLVGLIPVRRTMSRTPAQILSRTDI